MQWEHPQKTLLFSESEETSTEFTKKPSSDKFVPTKSPMLVDHENDTSDVNSEENDEDEGEHKVEVPFYPTIDGKPPKVSQDGGKPFKKFHGKEGSKKDQYNSNNAFVPPNYDNKYHVNNNYDQQPGPGFFNPDASKNQYPEHNTDIPIHHQHPVDKQLFNILGQNAPNIPPHIRIDQLLQHIQGQDQNQGPLSHGFQPIQIANGINYNQYGENTDHNAHRPGSYLNLLFLLKFFRFTKIITVSKCDFIARHSHIFICFLSLIWFSVCVCVLPLHILFIYISTLLLLFILRT